MEGYNRYGIVDENTVPYQAIYHYDTINGMVTDAAREQGRQLNYFQPKIF